MIFNPVNYVETIDWRVGDSWWRKSAFSVVDRKEDNRVS